MTPRERTEALFNRICPHQPGRTGNHCRECVAEAMVPDRTSVEHAPHECDYWDGYADASDGKRLASDNVRMKHERDAAQARADAAEKERDDFDKMLLAQVDNQQACENALAAATQRAEAAEATIADFHKTRIRKQTEREQQLEQRAADAEARATIEENKRKTAERRAWTSRENMEKYKARAEQLESVAKRMILASDNLDENEARLELEEMIVWSAPASPARCRRGRYDGICGATGPCEHRPASPATATKRDKAIAAWCRWYSKRLSDGFDYTGYEQDLFEAFYCRVPDDSLDSHPKERP
jgi:hypothetical protein